MDISLQCMYYGIMLFMSGESIVKFNGLYYTQTLLLPDTTHPTSALSSCKAAVGWYINGRTYHFKNQLLMLKHLHNNYYA